MPSRWTFRLARWLPYISLLGILGFGLLALRQQGSFREHLRRSVSWELSRQLGHRARVKDCELALLSAQTKAGERQVPIRLRLTVKDLSVEQPAGWEGEFLSASELQFDMDIAKLLAGGSALASLDKARIIRPEVQLARNRQGRWNITDLLARRPKKPLQLAGRIEIVEGHLSLQDYAPPAGLKAPQFNHLDQVNCLIAALPAYDKKGQLSPAGKYQFRVWAKNPEGRLSRLFAYGQWVQDGNQSRGIDGQLSGSVAVSKVDLGYAWHYRFFSPKIEIPKGQADMTGYFLARTRTQKKALLDYSLIATGEQAEVGLPWLKGNAQKVAGVVRASNGLVQLSGLTGEFGGAQVAGGGYVVAAARGRASKPQPITPANGKPVIVSRATTRGYAFHITATKAAGRPLARLLPEALAEAVRGMDSSGAVSMEIVGKGTESALFGVVSSPRWVFESNSLARYSGQQALPGLLKGKRAEISHMTANFIYAQKSLGASAKGALFDGRAQMAISLPPSGKGQFSAVLAALKLPPTALPGGGLISGAAWSNIEGELASRSRKSNAAALRGELALVNGVIQLPAKYGEAQRFPFNSARADFAVAKGALTISAAELDTGYGLLNAAGIISPAGRLAATLQGRSIDLARLDKSLSAGLSGTAFVSATLSGTITDPQANVRADIFAGECSGYGFDWIGADAQLRKQEISHFALTLQRGTGEGSLSGRLVFPRGTYPGFLSAEGRVEKGQLEYWLPFSELRGQAKGIFDATVKLQGSLDSPEIAANFRLLRPQVAGMQFDSAEGELRYEKGALLLPSFSAQVDGAKLTASGRMPSEGALDFNFDAEGLRLASLLQALQTGAAVDGRLFMQGHLTGTQETPRLALHLRAEDTSLGGLRAGNLESDLSWDNHQLEFGNFDFALQGGHLRLAGDVAKTTKDAAISAWRSNLKVNADGLPLGLLFDLINKSLVGSGNTRLQAALDKIPRPIHGFLTASAGIVGPVLSPMVEAGFVISDASLADQRLPSLEGKVGYEARKLTLHSFTANEGEANANASGIVDFAGETTLNVDIHNLRAETLRPWLPWITALGGSADSYLRVTGPTSSPSIRGDMEVTDPVLGDIKLDRFKIDSFALADDTLEIENIRLVKGANRLRFSASVPYSWRARRLRGDGALWAEALVEPQDLSLINVLRPGLGDISGPLEAQLVVKGTPDHPLLESGFLRADGVWKKGGLGARLMVDSEVVNHVLQIGAPDGRPGITISMERPAKGPAPSANPKQNRGKAEAPAPSLGTIRISGFYDPFAGPKSRWGLGKYEIALKADKLEGDIAKIISGIATADLTLRGDPEAQPMDKISGAIQIANAKVTIPRKAITGGFSWRPRFSPQMDIALTARDVHVATATAQVILAGKGNIGGQLGYEPMALNMKLGAKKGKLDFPAAAAEIKTLDVTVSKQPEQPLTVFGRIEAQARVGRYRMDLSGGGALFPASNLTIHTTSTPPLTDAQAMALLLGVPPSTLGTAGLPPEQALGTEVANRLASPVAALAATGVSAPLLRAIGLDELSIGMASIAVGKRLAKTIYLYYVSPTGGAANATNAGSATATGLTRVIIDVTPQASIGFSVNDLQQWRYEIQSIRLF